MCMGGKTTRIYAAWAFAAIYVHVPYTYKIATATKGVHVVYRSEASRTAKTMLGNQGMSEEACGLKTYLRAKEF